MQLELIMFVHLTANGTFTPRSRDTNCNPPPHPRQNPKLTFIIHRWHKGISHTKDCGIWNVNSFQTDQSLLTSRVTDHGGFESDGNAFFRNVGKHVLSDTPSHPRRLEFSATCENLRFRLTAKFS